MCFYPLQITLALAQGFSDIFLKVLTKIMIWFSGDTTVTRTQVSYVSFSGYVP